MVLHTPPWTLLNTDPQVNTPVSPQAKAGEWVTFFILFLIYYNISADVAVPKHLQQRRLMETDRFYRKTLLIPFDFITWMETVSSMFISLPNSNNQDGQIEK